MHGIIISNNGVRLFLNEVDTKMHSTSVKEMFYFKAIRCCNSVLGENILCVECSNQLFFLQRKCYDAARMRTEGISNTKTNNTYLCNSPLLLIFKVD